MATREYELVRDAVDATEQEIFDEVLPPRTRSMYDNSAEAYEQSVIDDSGDRSLEMDDRIDGEGKVDPSQAYDDGIGEGPPPEQDEDEVAYNELREENAQLRKERDEWKARAEDDTRERAYEQRQAGLQFVEQNKEQALDMINAGYQQAGQQNVLRVQQALTYGAQMHGDRFIDECKLIAADTVNEASHYNRLCTARDPVETALDIAAEIRGRHNRGADRGSSRSRWPGSLVTGQPASGTRGRSAPAWPASTARGDFDDRRDVSWGDDGGGNLPPWTNQEVKDILER
jgi:hypothetical protein